jgi:hypothetical protein
VAGKTICDLYGGRHNFKKYGGYGVLSFDSNSNIHNAGGDKVTPENLNLNSLNPEPPPPQQQFFKNNLTDMHSIASVASGWQDDGMGNVVALDGDRLVTRNEKGQIVDYDEHIEGKRSAAHQDLAITSMMMINPFMIFGLGAGMSFMNDSYMNNRQKRLDSLKAKLKGHSRNVSTQDGDENDMQQRMNGAQSNKYMSTIEAYHFVNSFNQPRRELMNKHKTSPNFEKFENVSDRLRTQAAATARKSLSIQKLVKDKLKIQDTIEKMRGKATLEEMSRWYSQLEVLDRAIKNTQDFL